MAACLLIAGQPLALATAVFTLGWTHSVEKTGWQERWRIEGATLVLVEARVRGSGAGMDPGEGAWLQDGWWVWTSDLKVPNLTLAASGATGAGWQLCADGECRELGAMPGAALTVAPCRGE